MTAHIINGRMIAKNKNENLRSILSNNRGSRPKMAIILANRDDASRIYVSRKMAACEHVGIDSVLIECPNDHTDTDILAVINDLNTDESVHGIFLQLPVFEHLNAHDLIQHINPIKDIDGLTVTNMGRLISGDRNGLAPCTPQGVMEILNHEKIDLIGKHAVIIGRSLLFGKPMGQLLLQADCTVTHCHSKTADLPAIARQADILISATGQAKMVKADWVKPGATVIDVGINRMDNGKICGDVDFDSVKDIAGAITPVPGGVGPMTVACLLANTVRAFKA